MGPVQSEGIRDTLTLLQESDKGLGATVVI